MAIEAFPIAEMDDNSSPGVLHSATWARLFVEALDQMVNNLDILGQNLCQFCTSLPPCVLAFAYPPRDSSHSLIYKEAAAYLAQPAVRERVFGIFCRINSLREADQGQILNFHVKSQLSLTGFAWNVLCRVHCSPVPCCGTLMMTLLVILLQIGN